MDKLTPNIPVSLGRLLLRDAATYAHNDENQTVQILGTKIDSLAQQGTM